jgi:hypothetical protein
MSKKITVFADNAGPSRQVLKFIVKNGIPHDLVTDQDIVNKMKEALNFEPPIILCFDEDTNEFSILENKKELMEIKNGNR